MLKQGGHFNLKGKNIKLKKRIDRTLSNQMDQNPGPITNCQEADRRF
jgi:hypothetical protein